MLLHGMARPSDDHDDGLHGDHGAQDDVPHDVLHDAQDDVPHDVLHDAPHGDFRRDLRQTIP